MSQFLAQIAFPVAPASPARTRTMLSALFANQQLSQTCCESPMRPLAKTRRQKARGSPAPCGIAPRPRGGAKVAQRGRLTSAPTASTPESKVSRPLATTARTPDSKVTRQQASSKQCAGKRASSRGERAGKKRRWHSDLRPQASGLRYQDGWSSVAAGAEGACQETDAEHWQRHSSQLGAHVLCCRCNFIKRRMAIKLDFPWFSLRPRSMGGLWRLGCHTCSWVVAIHPGGKAIHPAALQERGFARYGFVFHGTWKHMKNFLRSHAKASGHRAATLLHSSLLDC